MTDDTARRIWRWLPKRADSRRVTLPMTIAVALDLALPDVVATLTAMERAGYVVRDRSDRESGWHRGTPLPTAPATDDPPDAWTLY
jgi:hypothetical protein